MCKQKLSCYLKDCFKNRKIFLMLLTICFVFCFTSVIYLIATSNFKNSFGVALVMLAVPLILLFEWILNIKIPVLLLGLLLFVCIGSVLGSSFEFYNTFIWFDDLLHTLSGFIFACFGFTLTEIFVGKIDNKKKFIGCLLGGFVFSLAIGVIWEMIEYAGLIFFEVDMQEDMYINEFRSFFLSGSHRYSVDIMDINKTIIYFGNGESIVLNGYLDIGLFDTLNDMFVCFIGAIIYLIVLTLGHKKIKLISNMFCPVICDNNQNDMLE